MTTVILLRSNGWLTIKFLLLLTLVYLPNLLVSQATVQTNNNPPVYDVNENITFSVINVSGTATADVFYDKTNGAPPPYLFSNPISNGSPITYAHPEAGVVLCDINQGSPDANIRAALIDPFEIDPFTAEPFSPTFESHWADVIADIPSTSNPLYSSLTPSSSQPSSAAYDAYDLLFDNVDGKQVSGFLMVPDDLAPGEKVPAIIRIPPYTGSASSTDGTFLPMAEDVRAIVLHVNAHPVGESTGYPSGAGDYADADTYHYKQAAAGIIRMIDYIESQTSIYNGKLAFFGESQGGGLSLLVAGIDDRVDGICISAPALCEHKGRMLGKASGFPDYIVRGDVQGVSANDVVNAARYYDAAISAKRIDVPCFVQIGHEDQTSPSATSLAAVNQLRNAVHITHGFNHEHTHGFGGFYGAASVMFLQRVLNGVTTETSGSVKYYYADAGPSAINATANVAETFNGSISENAGTYNGGLLWESIEGPATPTISNPNSASPNITFPQNGTYVIRLSAAPLYIPHPSNNDIFYTVFDYVTVTVGPGGGNCTPSVSPGSLNLSENSGSTSISVSGISNGWNVSASQSWLNVSNSGNNSISVTYDANPTSNTRTANITITCTNGVQASPIVVTQDGVTGGACSLVTIDASMFFNPDGTAASGSLHGNALGDEQSLIGDPVNGDFNNSVSTDWQYPWAANAQTYLALPQTYNLEKIWLYEGWGTGEFTVALGLPSDGNAPFLTITTDQAPPAVREFDFPAGTQAQYLTFTKVSTSGKIREIALCGSTGTPPPTCNPTFSPGSLTLSENSGSTSISVSGISGGWSVTSSETWLNVSNSNDTDISVTYSANPGTNARNATITLTCANGVQSNPITVSQNGMAGPTCTPTVSPGSLTLSENSGSTSVSVSGISNGWTVNASETWLNVSNSGNNSISVTYSANPGTSSRNANITITCTNGVQANAIPVTQAGMTGGACSLVTIDASMFFNPDGTAASGSLHGNALGDEQSLIGDPVNGDFNNSVSTDWQYPWAANAQTYLALPQTYNLEKIWLYEGWGTGEFTVALGLPSDGNAPFLTITTDQAPPAVREFDFPAGTQAQYLTFTKVSTSGKIREIALCGSTGTPPPTCNPTFSPGSLTLSENSGSTSISVSGISGGWSVTSSETWLNVSNSNDTDINVTYSANPGTNARNATITLTCANGVQSGGISVAQSGTPVSGNDLEVTVTPSVSQITPSQVFTSTLKVKNTTGSTISGINVDCLNMNYNHVSGSGNAFTLQNSGSLSPSHGSYNWWTAQWSVGSLNAGEEATIAFDFKIKTSSSCQPGIVMESTATEGSNSYTGSNTVDCSSSFTSSTSDHLKLTQQDIDVYPNPALNELQVHIKNPDFVVSSISITDQLGAKILFEKELIKSSDNTYVLDISNLPEGIYFLSVENDLSQGAPVKFIKMNR